ncbi:MAG: universal stress protein [Burkholderiales bacterium]|jgi:nucleotide-binding universal stress UspA family protein|nr:universal stress protein [Burkholderiales bacterium]
MAQYRSILVPIDIAEPDTARPAIERAVDLAHASNGTIRLIYVRSILPVTYMEFVPPSFDAEQQREAEQKLATIAAGIPLPTERVSAVVTMGSVYDDVLREAEKFDADLIIVGSHRPSMATYLIGSNAVRIVRHAKCSVLVVR